MWIQLDDERLANDDSELARYVRERLQHYTDIETSDAEKYREAAQQLYQSDGEWEIDDDAVVSEGGDPGAYVMAWRWVEAGEAGIPVCSTCGEVLDEYTEDAFDEELCFMCKDAREEPA